MKQLCFECLACDLSFTGEVASVFVAIGLSYELSIAITEAPSMSLNS